MKYKKLILFLCLFLFALTVSAQTITYRFTAESNCEYFPLDSIIVNNITQEGDTILYYPDTVLNFTFSGIDNGLRICNKLNLSQNYPNPFSDETYFELFVPESGTVNLSVFDMTGRLVCCSRNFYEVGAYNFKFRSGTGNAYVLSAQSDNDFHRIIMISTNSNPTSSAELVFVEKPMEFKSHIRSKSTGFPYSIGDELSFTGYITNEISEIDFESISDDPIESSDYTFIFNNGVPEQPDAIIGQPMMCSGQVQTLNYQVTNTPGMTYNWTFPVGWNIIEGEGTNSVNVLTSENSGTISVCAENACGISTGASIEVSIAAIPNIVGDTIYCSDQNIQMAIDGGCIWNWSGPSGFTSQSQFINTPAINLLGGGFFYVTIVDSYGCTYTDIQAVYVNNAPQVVVICSQVATCGLSDGELTVNVTGGLPPYYYFWVPWATEENVSVVGNLASGSYQLTVADNNGCAVVEQGFVLQNSDLSVNANTLSDVTCYGYVNGIVDVAINGGTSPYEFWWSPGQVTQTVTNLTTGQYDVIVMDANGCTASDYTIVNEPDPLAIVFNVNNATSPTSNDGSIFITIYGGTAGYTIDWQLDQAFIDENSYLIPNLSTGIYAIIITDSNGCVITDTVDVNSP